MLCQTLEEKNMLSAGIIGLGTIGNVVAKALDEGINGMSLVAIASGRRDKALASIAGLSSPVELMSIDEVAACCDVIVDCAPKSVFRDIAVAAFSRGPILVNVSGAGINAK
jgi:aspartate dehydrogenase